MLRSVLHFQTTNSGTRYIFEEYPQSKPNFTSNQSVSDINLVHANFKLFCDMGASSDT